MWKKKFKNDFSKNFRVFQMFWAFWTMKIAQKNNLKKVKTPEKPDDFADFDYFFQKFTWSLVKFEEAKKSGWGLKK